MCCFREVVSGRAEVGSSSVQEEHRRAKEGGDGFFPQDHVESPGQSLELNQLLPNFKDCTSTMHSSVSSQGLVNINTLVHIFESKSLPL